MKKNTAIITGAIMLFVFVVTLVTLVVLVSQKEEEQIPKEQPIISKDVRIDREKLQSKEVDSNLPNLLEEKKKGDKLTLELFDGESLECKVEEAKDEGPDVKSVLCSSSRFTAYFSFDDDIVLGTIDDYTKPEQSYILVSDIETGKIFLEEHQKAL